MLIGDILLSTHAASPYASVEAESGQLEVGATEDGGTDASGQEYVHFALPPSSIAPAGTYTYITMPASGLTEMSHDVGINRVPNLGTSDFFWSDQFAFTDGPSGSGAYVGLQGIDKVLFSVFGWPSTEASSDCTVDQGGFDGGAYAEGGTSCIMSYTVTQSDTYRLVVSEKSTDSDGINWTATVENLETSVTTTIATVNIPTSWGTLANWEDVWTEYFGPTITSCSALPYSNVSFKNFTANNGEYTAPSSHSDSITQNDCSSTSSVTDNSDDAFEQIMGNL